MSEQFYRLLLWNLIDVGDNDHIAIIGLLLASSEVRESLVKQGIAEEVFVVPGPCAVDWIFNDIMQHLRMERGEVVPVSFQDSGLW